MQVAVHVAGTGILLLVRDDRLLISGHLHPSLVKGSVILRLIILATNFARLSRQSGECSSEPHTVKKRQ